jgi:3-oxoacyl-[acyl-carrier-protein] synthase II
VSERRVAITGLGPVTPIGIGVEPFWDGLRSARSVVRTLTRFDPAPFRSHVAAEVDGFDPSVYMEPRRAKRLDRCSQFTLAAARLALVDAGIELEREDRERIGAMMGTALGGVAFAEQEHGKYLAGGVRAVEPGLALTVFVGAASCNLAIELGISGPNITNGMSCASGAIAIGEAVRAIQRGEADVMLAGGAEAPLSPLSYGAFAIIRAMSTRNEDPATASRPFDRDRDGFVMAEGAAVLVLEERERARARGATIYAEVVGYGLTNDAHHMTAPRPDGRQAARAMQTALSTAGVPGEAVDYVNAHGSSTPLNDPTEALALRQVLGRHAERVPISGTKGYYGHALGASGAIEAAI